MPVPSHSRVCLVSEAFFLYVCVRVCGRVCGRVCVCLASGWQAVRVHHRWSRFGWLSRGESPSLPTTVAVGESTLSGQLCRHWRIVSGCVATAVWASVTHGMGIVSLLVNAFYCHIVGHCFLRTAAPTLCASRSLWRQRRSRPSSEHVPHPSRCGVCRRRASTTSTLTSCWSRRRTSRHCPPLVTTRPLTQASRCDGSWS